MSAAQPDPLAEWRTARAARSVASVASAEKPLVTHANPQKSAIVASVASVASENMQGGDATAFYAAPPESALAALAAPDPIAPLACHWSLARLAALEAEGATPLLCPFGGQNWQRPDGREAWFSCATMLRLHAAGLVPGSVPDRPPP